LYPDDQEIFLNEDFGNEILLDEADSDEEVATIRQQQERFDMGGGYFVKNFPDLKKETSTKAWNSSASIVTSFEREVQKQIKITAMSTHVQRVIEARLSTNVASKTRSKTVGHQKAKAARFSYSRNLVGLNAQLDGWQRAVDDLCKSDEPKGPGITDY
jgi:hypothetical protein